MALYLGLLLRFLAAELPIAVPFVLLPMSMLKFRSGIRIGLADRVFVCLILPIIFLGLFNWMVFFHYLGYLLVYFIAKVFDMKLSKWVFRIFVASVVIYSLIMIIDRSIYVQRSINYLLLTKLHLFALAILASLRNKNFLVYLILSCVILFSLFLTHARTNAILGLLLVLYGLFRSISFKKNWLTVSILLFGLMYLFLYGQPYIQELKAVQRIYTDSNSSAMRYELWLNATRQIDLGSLVIGHGPGASIELANSVGMPYFHNLFLEWIYDYGLCGLALSMFFIFSGVKALSLLRASDKSIQVLIALLFLIELLQFLKSFDGLQIWSLCIMTSLLWKE